MTFDPRGVAAVAGIGETPFYRRGEAPYPEAALRLQAVVAACRDAGVDPADVDGFVTYGHDPTEITKMMPALGTRELRWASLVFGGGGGGIAGAIAEAVAAVALGHARNVIVYRALAQAQSGRLAFAVSAAFFDDHYRAHGVVAPAQPCALRTQRLIEHDGVPISTLQALARAGYHHARNNPRAVGRDLHLTEQRYLDSRWISEPLRLYDSSRENDGAAALLITSADAARHLAQPPAYILGAVQGAGPEWGELHENDADYSSGGYRVIAQRLWDAARLGPGDVDVAQVYENFTGPAIAALIDHGFVTADDAGEKLTFENLIAPDGWLPVNTAGGNIADGFLHGINLAVEAVRQIRGTSPNPVPGAEVSLLIGGPHAPLVSSALFGTERTL